MTSRHYCFTLYSEDLTEDYTHEWRCSKDLVNYAICQLERCPESLRLHLQGYVEFSSPSRVSGAKTKLGMPSAHVERRNGTREEARNYCMKLETRLSGPWEFGDWSAKAQGRRSDLAVLASAIKEGGLTVEGVQELNPQLYCQYRNGIRDLVATATKASCKKWRVVDVWILWGDSGTGKSRAAFDCDDYFLLDQSSDGKNVWFDGYDGESTLVIDDFYGWIRYSFFLRMLDGHPVRLPIKGSHTYANWTTVIITSNQNPHNWYHWGDNLVQAALKRRVTNMTKFVLEDGVASSAPWEWDDWA